MLLAILKDWRNWRVLNEVSWCRSPPFISLAYALNDRRIAQAGVNFFMFMSLGSFCRNALMGPELRDFEAFIEHVIRGLNTVFDGVPMFFIVDGWRSLLMLWVFFLFFRGRPITYLTDIGPQELEEKEKQEVSDRCHTFLKSQIKAYQSDYRLRLLVVLMHPKIDIAPKWERSGCNTAWHTEIDILLGLDNDNLRLVDTNALHLRYTRWPWIPDDYDTITDSILSEFSADGDGYVSAALHCMRFLSNSP